jgi:S-DNA-T family DNA segregation ATPase FtsK/SpoIIIE
MDSDLMRDPDGRVIDLAAARQARTSTRDLVPTVTPAAAVELEPIPASVETVECVVLASADKRVKGPDAPRRPVVPDWLRDRDSARSAVRWAAEYGLHCTAFHAVRTPLYLGKVCGRSPIGAGRVTAATWAWVFDTSHREQRHAAERQATDPAAFLRMQDDRRRQVRGRALLALFGLLGVVLALVVVASAAPLGGVVAVLGAVVALGLIGRAENTRVTGRAVDTAQMPPLTADLIVSALGTLGLATISSALSRQGTAAVGFPGPITRDGPGWRADVDLPGGATAGEVIDRRSKLASGLRRPMGCVWPEADPEVHEGRLVLWVGDKALSDSKPVPWPLVKAGKVNLFEPIIIGTDQRGRPVTVTLMFAAVLIGAVPRMGKTFLLRLLLLAASLDVRCELRVYDLKGGADLLPLAQVAHSFRVGDDPEDIAYLVADLRNLRAEMRRRYQVLRSLPREACPESKVTDDLANDRSLGLHPIVLAMDECGLAFDHADVGKEVTEIVVDLVKRGPAAGIIVIPATQRIDVASVPAGVSANAVLRFALKVMDHTANDMILGSGMYKAGVRATMFNRSDRGVALLVGEGDEPALVRAAYVDSPTAETVALRARAARAAANRLTGLAAGEDVEPDTSTGSVLDHLTAIWPTTPDGPASKVWSDDLADRLAEHMPDLYGGWSAEQVSAAVRPHGLSTVQVKRTIDGRQVNRRGLDHAALAAALDGRDDPEPPTGVLAPTPNPMQ